MDGSGEAIHEQMMNYINPPDTQTEEGLSEPAAKSAVTSYEPLYFEHEIREAMKDPSSDEAYRLWQIRYDSPGISDEERQRYADLFPAFASEYAREGSIPLSEKEDWEGETNRRRSAAAQSDLAASYADRGDPAEVTTNWEFSGLIERNPEEAYLLYKEILKSDASDEVKNSYRAQAPADFADRFARDRGRVSRPDEDTFAALPSEFEDTRTEEGVSEPPPATREESREHAKRDGLWVWDDIPHFDTFVSKPYDELNDRNKSRLDRLALGVALGLSIDDMLELDLTNKYFPDSMIVDDEGILFFDQGTSGKGSFIRSHYVEIDMNEMSSRFN